MLPITLKLQSRVKEHWPFIVYTLLIVGAFFFHEAGGDEIQALLIAKAPLKANELIKSINHYTEDHLVWIYTLKLFSLFDVSPLGLQLANSVFIVGAAALFWWKAPLDKSLKTLLIFNYFFLYEFGVIARSYSLGIFLTLFYISFCGSKKKNLYALSFLALMLSSHVSIYTLIISSVLFIPHFFDQFKINSRTALFQALLFSSSIYLAILQMIPAADQNLAPPSSIIFSYEKIQTIAKLIGETFFYIPNLPIFPNIWNTSLSLPPAILFLRALFSLILFVIFTYFIYKKRPLLAGALIAGILVLLSFAYFKFMGSLRHMSHVLLLMLSFYWLSQKKNELPVSSSAKHILSAIFAISICSGALNYFADLMMPFSDAKNVSKVISSTDTFIAGMPDYAVSTVSGFMQGREIYYLNGNRMGTYVKWNHKKDAEVNFKESMLDAFKKYNVDEAILISSVPEINQQLKLITPNDLLYESLACIVPDECFHVYRIRKQHLLVNP